MEAPAGETDSLSLEELLALAVQYNPDIAIARERALAARGRMIQAGLYPNPTVNWEADDVANGSNAAGTQGAFLHPDHHHRPQAAHCSVGGCLRGCGGGLAGGHALV